MKGAIFAMLCAIALTHGAVTINENGCPLDSNIDTLLPHPNCDQFYQCVHGELIEKDCATGLHFNPEFSVCDFPEAAKCQNENIVAQHDVIQAANTYIAKDTEDNLGSGNDDPSQARTICAASDSDGVLVAHENCNQFYKCSFGLPVAIECPSSLLFDASKDRCEWPDTVECGDRVIPEGNGNGNEGVWEGNGAGNDDPSQAPTICAAEGSDHSYVAHEYCDLFYQCWAGAPVALKCPPGYLFNPKQDYCDFPDNVDCGDKLISENFDSDNNNENGNIEDETPIGNNHDDPSQAPAICEAADSSGVLVAHENCNQFYKCTFGLPVAVDCPTSLLFDPSKDRCEWSNTVECGDRIIPEGNGNSNEGVWEGNGAGNDDPSQAPVICAAEGSDHSYVAHEYCDMFYQCWAGAPVALKCPPGHLFNPKQDYCDFPKNVDCGDKLISENFDSDDNKLDLNVKEDSPIGNNHDDPSQAPTICEAADSSGVLVAHENCNQFYMCTFGLPVAVDCPATLLFDPSKDRCEWPDTVDCGSRVIPEGDSNGNGNEGVWEGNGAGNDDPSQAPAICAAEGSDHSYVAHEYCDMFYQCWAGAPVPLDCPAGYLFNPKQDYCDFPANVDCGERIIRNA